MHNFNENQISFFTLVPQFSRKNLNYSLTKKQFHTVYARLVILHLESLCPLFAGCNVIQEAELIYYLVEQFTSFLPN